MKLVVIDGNSIVNRAFYGVRALTAASNSSSDMGLSSIGSAPSRRRMVKRGDCFRSIESLDLDVWSLMVLTRCRKGS